MGAARALFVLDVVAMTAIILTRGAVSPGQIDSGVVTLVLASANLLSFYALGLYRRDVIIATRKAVLRAMFAAAFATACGAVVLCGIGLRTMTSSDIMTKAGLFAAVGIGVRLIFHRLRRRGLIGRLVLVVGAGRRAWDLMHLLRKEGSGLPYNLVFLHDPSLGEVDPRLRQPGIRVLSAPLASLLSVARRVNADQVVIAPDDRRGVRLEGPLACKTAGFPVSQYLSFVERELRRVDIKRIEVSWVLYSDGFHFGLLDLVLKRALDLMIAIPFLLAASPFLLIAMAAVRLADGGPAFYRQTRVTCGGQNFEILKLRTMSVQAEVAGAAWAAASDPRVTRVGHFLRRTRLDEIPQLFNVLRGEMSLVGPRPERPAFVNMLAAQIPLYGERHMVKAGLTGWAQVNYPYGASIDDARSKLSYDLFYVKNFSLLFDLAIIAQTLRVVLWPSGVR
jgi:sugar transferase (PEP-CTERM system associated)